MVKVCDKATSLLEEISILADKAGTNNLKIMAVTKNRSVDLIEEARIAGFTLFGENKVQEFLSKEEYFSTKELEVHLIGHLQTNKVKQAVGKFSIIQSVDSINVATAIDKEASKKNIIQDILLEVNIGREENKYGFLIENIYEALCEISLLKNIHLCGLMTIPPITESNEARRYFCMMKSLFIDITTKKIDNVSMNILSMGMSSDYKEAIMEGSNMVRLGTAIFG